MDNQGKFLARWECDSGAACMVGGQSLAFFTLRKHGPSMDTVLSPETAFSTESVVHVMVPNVLNGMDVHSMVVLRC
jgi:hypothetical protein